MKKSIFTYLTLTLFIGLSACQDDELFSFRETGNGVDWNNIVEVTLPIKTSHTIQSNIVTRAGEKTGTDSQIKDILVFVYEIKKLPNGELDLPNCKRVTFQYFSRPGTGSDFGSDTGGGWIPDPSNPDQGTIKFYAPAGEVYIYLIANSTGSLIDFFPGVTQIGGTGENDELSTLEQCWENGIPTWKENLFSTDGYLPMVGLVNNVSGNCTITDEGKIKFTKSNGTEVTMGQSTDAQDNYFQLQRLVSKISVNIKSADGITFTPKEYCFRHVSQHVSPIISSWSEEEKRNLPTKDTPYIKFTTQEPNSFTVYLPENVKECPSSLNSYAERDMVYKKENGENALETEADPTGKIPSYIWPEGSNQNDHQGHYHFINAPRNSTYLEIKGRYEGPVNGSENASADTKYFIHLGDFSNEQWQNFCLERDHYYNYTITVNGVNSIYTEVTTSPTDSPQEPQPGAEGIIFTGGTTLMLDSHYEQVEMKIDRNWVNGGTFIYADTPYGLVSGMYYAKNFKDDNGNTYPQAGQFIAEGPSDAKNEADVEALTKWIVFKQQQNGENSLEKYNSSVKSVIDMLEEFYESNKNTDFYTCFIDEYYYTELPSVSSFNLKYSKLELSQFINTVDRTFGLSSDLDYSLDGKSAVAHNELLIQQRSIACFYDLTNTTVAKYGIESIDEVADSNGDGRKDRDISYGIPNRTASDTNLKSGLQNTRTELGTDIDLDTYVDHTQNGWLWNNGNPQRGNGLKPGYQYGYLSCLTRNRDFNANGRLETDELRWYTPSRDQLIGVWIGEDAMPRDAALYRFNTTTELAGKTSETCDYPIFSSSNGGNRQIWGEQGCAFGDANGPGMVFTVRNLGNNIGEPANQATQSHTQAPDNFYQWNSVDRTIEVYLSESALRPFTNQELRPHHERSEINRPYKKFKIAKEMYHKKATKTFTCGRNISHWNDVTNNIDRDWLQFTIPEQAMGEWGNTIASQYTEADDPAIGPQWRLPNQRELALMVLANVMENKSDPIWETYPSDMKHIHPILGNNYWDEEYGIKIFYTRTHFSNSEIRKTIEPNAPMPEAAYTEYGFIYHAGDQQIQMMSYPTFKTAGYWCVKDVRVE